jgi:hypothetical protein
MLSFPWPNKYVPTPFAEEDQEEGVGMDEGRPDAGVNVPPSPPGDLKKEASLVCRPSWSARGFNNFIDLSDYVEGNQKDK